MPVRGLQQCVGQGGETTRTPGGLVLGSPRTLMLQSVIPHSTCICSKETLSGRSRPMLLLFSMHLPSRWEDRDNAYPFRPVPSHAPTLGRHSPRPGPPRLSQSLAHRLALPHTARYRPIPPDTDPYRPIPTHTARYRPIPCGEVLGQGDLHGHAAGDGALGVRAPVPLVHPVHHGV